MTVRPTVDASTVDAPIPALLPRDWPRLVDELCDDLDASPVARAAARRLVDGWVLAASDRDATPTAPTGEAFDAVFPTGTSGDPAV